MDDCSADTQGFTSRRPKLKLCRVPQIVLQKFSFGAKPD